MYILCHVFGFANSNEVTEKTNLKENVPLIQNVLFFKGIITPL